MLTPEAVLVDSIVKDHFFRIDAMWRRNSHLFDLLGVLCVEHGRWSLAMSRRQDKIEEAPALIWHVPQVVRPAWTAAPQLLPGTAMWLLVGAPGSGWTCLRVQRALRS
jgi:hypothetical protein